MSMVQPSLIRGMGRPHWDMLSSLSVVLMTAGLLTVALPFGIEAAAAAVVLGFMAVWPIDALFVRRLTACPCARKPRRSPGRVSLPS